MRLLLDTHVLVWALVSPDRLPSQVRSMIEDRRNDVCFSVVSLLEIASKRSSKSRSAPPISSEVAFRAAHDAGLREIRVTAEHAVAVQTIALAHPDLSDRLLLAQAQVERLHLLTHDEALAQFDQQLILF